MDRVNRPRLAVSVCLAGQDGQVLLVRRENAPFEALLSLPGGKVEFGERTEDAARRELFEETGVTAGDLLFLTLHEALDADTHAVIAVYAGRLPQECAPVAGDDAASAVLVDVAAVHAIDRKGGTTPGLARIVAAAFDAVDRAASGNEIR